MRRMSSPSGSQGFSWTFSTLAKGGPQDRGTIEMSSIEGSDQFTLAQYEDAITQP